MNKKFIVPSSIILIQLIGLLYTYYLDQYGNAHIPLALIFLHFLSAFSVITLILAYFLYFKAKDKTCLWRVPICISVLILIFLLVIYVAMSVGKYW